MDSHAHHAVRQCQRVRRDGHDWPDDGDKDRSELGKVIAWRFLFSVIIALAAWFLLPLDERVREIVVLAAFAPVTIFSTKFTDSLTGNAKLAGFSLTVTAVIGLTIMTILHAVLPVA